MQRKQITGLILAGGLSRRFGSDKALHQIDGRRMIDLVLEAVRPLVGEVLISGQMESHVLENIDERVVRDRFKNRGPLAGLHAGLSESRSPWLMVAPCDMPFLTTTALERLARRCTNDAPVVVAVSSDGRRHPLCACYNQSVLPSIERSLFSEDFSVLRLIDAVPSIEVALPDAVLRNINRPSDLV